MNLNRKDLIVALSIVLVHGAFADSSSWNGVIDPLQGAGHRVIAAANPLRGLASDAAALSDLVRTIEDDWCDPDELQAVHRQIQELWESMDRAEAKLRSGSRRMSPLLWLE